MIYHRNQFFMNLFLELWYTSLAIDNVSGLYIFTINPFPVNWCSYLYSILHFHLRTMETNTLEELFSNCVIRGNILLFKHISLDFRRYPFRIFTHIFCLWIKSRSWISKINVNFLFIGTDNAYSSNSLTDIKYKSC